MMKVEKPMNENPLMEVNGENIVLFHPHISDRARTYVNETLNTRWIGQGPKVDKFENMFVDRFAKDHHALSCGSGTDALHLSYLLAGLSWSENAKRSLVVPSAILTELTAF
jgi:dTDP-4-amino-4,6-dideoxygalactose transaminase